MVNFIDGDFFESLADVSFGDDYKNYKDIGLEYLENMSRGRDVVFLCINTDRLFSVIDLVKNYDKKIVIISHNSDVTLGENLYNYPKDNISCIWCQNYNFIETDNLKSLPIGLERSIWFPAQQKQQRIKERLDFNFDIKNLVYFNCNLNTNISHRTEVFRQLQSKSFIKKELLGNGNDYIHYIEEILSSQYVICPDGNGLDTHRAWEVLYLGRFPIIKRSKFSENIYKDLPVLIINDFSDISEQLLVDNIEILRYASKKNLDPIVWKEKIKS